MAGELKDTNVCYLLGLAKASPHNGAVTILWGDYSTSIHPKRLSPQFFNDIIDIYQMLSTAFKQFAIRLEVPDGVELTHVNIVYNENALLNDITIAELSSTITSLPIGYQKAFLQGVINAGAVNANGEISVIIPDSLNELICQILKNLTGYDYVINQIIDANEIVNITKGGIIQSKLEMLSETSLCVFHNVDTSINKPEELKQYIRPFSKYPSDDELYALGFIIGKGRIHVDIKQATVTASIKFNKSCIWDVRGDNIHRTGDPGPDILEYSLPDILRITSLFQQIFNIPIVPERLDIREGLSFRRTEIIWVLQIENDNYDVLQRLFPGKPIDSDLFDKPPSYLFDDNFPPNLAKSFLQGFCDDSAIIPGQESDTMGSGGRSRIQIEPDNCRWHWLIPLCHLFQHKMNVPVVNNNWPHPTIKCRRHPTRCLRHNHQFRVCAYSFQNVGFRFLVKKSAYEVFLKQMTRPRNIKFCPDNRRTYRNVTNDEYKAAFDSNRVGQITTEPYSCIDHEEDFIDLPIEIRNKHYSEFRLVCRDLGCLYVRDLLLARMNDLYDYM